MELGYDAEVAMQASNLYQDVYEAVEYIRHNLKNVEKKISARDIDHLISSKYKSIDFEYFVAIDFGTHGTGLGYAKKVRKEKLDKFTEKDDYEYITFMEQDWAGGGDAIKNKTDILLTYDGKFIAFGYDALNKLCVFISLRVFISSCVKFKY